MPVDRPRPAPNSVRTRGGRVEFGGSPRGLVAGGAGFCFGLGLGSVRGVRRWVRREWSFAVAVMRHRGWSFAFLFLVLLGGGIAFRQLQPEMNFSLPEAMFRTWSLVFGEAPDPYPESAWLQVMFFVMPVLGITVFLEAIVEISMMIRDRRRGEKDWCRIMAGSMRKHVVLVGLGRLGWRIYSLLRRLGHEVVVIERDEECSFLEDARRDGVALFLGDARREQWLVDANIKDARSIVIATNDDLANLEIALDARRINPKVHVVMRMFDPNMADKVREGFGIERAFSASAVAAPAFAAAAIEGTIESSIVVGDEIVVSQRRTVAASDAFEGLSVGELASKRAMGVIEFRRKGERRFFPGPEVRFEVGDEVVIQGTLDTVMAVSVAR